MSSKYPLSALLMEFGEQPATLRSSPRCEVGTARGELGGRPPGKRRRHGISTLRFVFVHRHWVQKRRTRKQRYRAESGWKRQVKSKRKKLEDRLRLKDPVVSVLQV